MLTWVRCKLVTHLKEAGLPRENNLKNDRNLPTRAILLRKVQRTAKPFTCTRVPNKTDLVIDPVRLKLSFGHANASVKSRHGLELYTFSLRVGVVNDVAECGGEGTIVLDFRLIFLAARVIHFNVNE